jgi:hypothetical protein
LDDVSAIVADYDPDNNGGQLLIEQLRANPAALLARSSADAVVNMSTASGVLLGAFNKLSDGSWYVFTLYAPLLG